MEARHLIRTGRSVSALAETVNSIYKAASIYSKRIWESVSEVELATLKWVH